MQLELKGVTKVFGETVALRGVDLKVPEGVRVLAFIGPSGGGKSTALRVAGGLEVPDAGKVIVDGKALTADEIELTRHRRRNGFLFQSFNLFPHLTALQNVKLPLTKVHGKNEEEAREIAERFLARFGLEKQMEQRPAEMSGGQQQRAALARALATAPKLLILDEPTSALDPEMTAEVLAVIEELCEGGQEILMSTHEMGFAKAVADHVVFLADGEVIEEGTQIFEGAREEAVRRFLSRVMRY